MSKIDSTPMAMLFLFCSPTQTRRKISQIPTEILVNIFQYLHLTQKLEYILVCRHLTSILHADYLFKSIELKVESTREELDDRIKALLEIGKPKNSPVKKCKQPVFMNITDSRVSITTLASTFPNLNYFYFNKRPIVERNDQVEENETLQSWRDNLEALIDTCGRPYCCLKLLEKGPFHYLKTLVITPDLGDIDGADSFLIYLIPMLTASPTVTTLCLDNCLIVYHQLDELYRVLPELSSLTLMGRCSLTFSHYQFDKPIVPVEKNEDI